MTSLAYTGEGLNSFALAHADFRTSDGNGIFQFRGMTRSTADGSLSLVAGAGVGIYGVLQSAPNVGESALVRIIGESKVLLGTGGTTMYAALQVDANGLFVAKTSTNVIVAYALAAGSAGDLITAWIVGSPLG